MWMPEAAGIVFGGGFPRGESLGLRQTAQRAIFYVQGELELAADIENPAVVLCDCGTVDGATYWPNHSNLWSSVGTTLEEQLGRYDAVIHRSTCGHLRPTVVITTRIRCASNLRLKRRRLMQGFCKRGSSIPAALSSSHPRTSSPRQPARSNFCVHQNPLRTRARGRPSRT